MRKLYIDQLIPGMLIGQVIYNDQGNVLLTRGTPLTEGYIESLRARNFPAVWIMDGVADDVEPPDILSPRLRAATTAHLQKLFLTAQSVPVHTQGAPVEIAMEELVTAAKSQLADVYRSAENIVDEVADARTLSGVVTLKSHDNYTWEHSVEVAISAVILGKRLGMESYDLSVLALGCLFHDLGKVAVPLEILNKQGKLTDEEFAIIKNHPEAGYQLAKKILGDGSIIARNVVRQHHERQDGKGYPRGLRGTNTFELRRRGLGPGFIIPPAEIAAIADVYSALATDRPYRPSMAPEKIIGLLRDMAGTQLNRALVAKFLSVLPVYPVCSEVVVISKKLKGYRGIVTAVNPKDMRRPVVRFLYSSSGQNVVPFDVDTAREHEIDLAPPIYAEMVAGG